MSELAVPPSGNPILQIYGEINDEQKKTFDALAEKDDQWADFGKSPAYWLVKEYIESLITRLEDLEGRAFETGVSSDEIVMRRAVIRLTKANLLSLVQKVERTTEVRGRKTPPRRGAV